jgi:threonylcarbamoyladenosine tRNA methylthiotransferase MtaB
MGRHWYTAARYARAIETLIAPHAVFGLGADVIAGFPGETDEDHRATGALVSSLPFTYLHVFPYSVRPGTAAERLPGRLPGYVIEARARELRALGEQHATRYAASRSGGMADVVVVRGDAREGLTEDYLTVAIDGVAAGRGQRLTRRLDLVEGRLVARPPVDPPAQRPL